MAIEERRLRGWKSIAAHLNVNQSTAIRWSKRDGFPVIRTRDGGSVYATREALDRWLEAEGGDRGQTPANDIDDVASQNVPDLASPSVLPSRGPLNRLGVAVVALLGVIAIVLVVALSSRSVEPATVEPIRDPALRTLYLSARSDWAERTPQSLSKAITRFQRIVALYPDFGPGFTGLADAYILSCEFNSVDRDEAFGRARAAVSTALALDPDDPDANRVMGFLAYWTTRDLSAARPYFVRALRARPSDDLIHLWFGNALIDGGDTRAGVEHLRQAVMLSPESPAVQTDYAIGLWQSGENTESLKLLADVQRRFPTNSAAPGADALFRLSTGDVEGYLRASRKWASLIGDQKQIDRVSREEAALAAGGARRTLEMMARDPAIDSPFWHGGNLTAAMAASLLGDRDALHARLTQTAARNERWRNLPFPRAAFMRWNDDAEIAPLIAEIFGASEATGATSR